MNVEYEVKRLERQIHEQPNNPVLHYKMGRIYMEAEDLPGAIRCFDKAVRLDPYYTEAHLDMGIVYTLMHQYETAFKEWQRMVDEDNDLRLDDIQYAQGRHRNIANIVREWEGFRSNAPGSPVVCFYMGFVYLVLGQLDLAIEEYNKALRLNPRYEQAHYFLGLCHMRKSLQSGSGSLEIEQAAQCFANELAIRPQMANALYWSGVASLELNKTAQGMKALQECLKIRPAYVKAHVRLGQAYNQAGNFEQATYHLQQAIQLKPKSANAHFELGKVLEKQYKMDLAIAHYAQSVELQPNNKNANLHLGVLYKNLGKPEEAHKYLTKAAQLDPNDGDVHYFLGMLNDQMKRYEDAVKAYTNALAVSPQHAYAQYGLGQAYKRKGAYQDAAREFQRAIEMNPRDIQARNALGETFFSMGHLEGALEEFTRVLDMNPRDLRAQYFHGASLFRLGRLDDAIGAYHKVVSTSPDSPYAHFSTGAVYVRQGMFDAARDEFDKATNLDPTSEADLNLLATLHLMGAMGMQYAETSKQLRDSYERMAIIFEKTVEAMVTAVDARDEYTRDHSMKVSTVAVWFGEYLQLSRTDLKKIRIGGLLHDIGKIGIPDFILRKPGKLTDWEFELMRNHPRIGWQILEHLELPWDVRPMVEFHHERWDGSGYPYGKKGKEIPLEAQIMSLADFWDALRSQRSYKKAFSADDTLEEMQKLRNKHFDSGLVDRFEAFVDWAADDKGDDWVRLYPT